MRPETGPMQFPDDWTGIFIRGDEAMIYAQVMHHVMRLVPEDERGHLAFLAMRGIVQTLGSCDQNDEDRPPPQQAVLKGE